MAATLSETVRLNLRVLVAVPDVPVIVTSCLVTIAALDETLKTMEVVVGAWFAYIGLGDMVSCVTPDGSPETEIVIGEVNGFARFSAAAITRTVYACPFAIVMPEGWYTASGPSAMLNSAPVTHCPFEHTDNAPVHAVPVASKGHSKHTSLS